MADEVVPEWQKYLQDRVKKKGEQSDPSWPAPAGRNYSPAPGPGPRPPYALT